MTCFRRVKGDGLDVARVSGEWKETVLKNVAEFDLNKGHGVDEDKKPAADVNAASGWGITGAFRRLNVD